MLHARLTRTKESVLVEMPLWSALTLSTALGVLANHFAWQQVPGNRCVCRIPLDTAREFAQKHSLPSGIHHAFTLACVDG
jgi:hypothetical protein